MTSTPLPSPGRRRRRTATVTLALAVIVAGLIALLAFLTMQPNANATNGPSTVAPMPLVPDEFRLTPDHGYIPEGDDLSPFDETVPALTRLDPSLLNALRRATTDAALSDVTITVTSGWRSAEYQQWLFENAVTTYGSKEEAARWVGTPEGSAHVIGEAVDIGSLGATDWLAQNGSDYGLCQIYANEAWHYELRPEAIGGACPQTITDASEDPRMSRP